MDDTYWSIERCGWAPCRESHEAVATTWHVEAEQSAGTPVLPQQRTDLPAPAEA